MPTVIKQISGNPTAAPVATVTRASGAGVNTQPRPLPAAAKTVKVWDPFVRIFHWTLLASVVTLVVSAHFGAQDLHMVLGIAVLVLLLARVVWGFVGNVHARFRSFAVSPFEAMHYLGEVLRGHPRNYVGHNPAGAWMVFILIGLLLLLGTTGLIMQATIEFEGPLVGLLRPLSDNVVREVAITHRIAINALYLLVPLHVLGVILASVQHRENLVIAMITGRKRAPYGGRPAH